MSTAIVGNSLGNIENWAGSAWRWASVVAFAFALAIFSPALLPADEAESLERFLGRLGLVDLQIQLHERQLAASTAAPQRLELARKLADLYAAGLVTSAGDAQRYDDLTRRVESLLTQVPEANTPSLQVVLLEADFNRAEKLLLPALVDPRRTAPRDEARQVLARIAPQLVSLMRDRGAAADKLSAELDALKDEPAPEREAEFRRVQVVAARASYLAGWANYYYGLLAGEEAGKPMLQEARGALRKLLTIDDTEEYAKIAPDSLGLETEGRARALVGLGQIEAALGNLEASAACFQLLDSAASPPILRDQAASFHLQGLVYAQRYEPAAVLVSRQVGGWQGAATKGKTLFCVTAVRAGAGASMATAEVSRKLIAAGLSGLVKLRQIGAARQLVRESNFDLAAEQGFFFRWLAAQELYTQAEKSKKPEEYRAAAAALTAALAAPDAQTEVAVAADCRYFLGWCYYKLGEHEQAAAAFQQAAAGRKASDASAAADAAWMAFVSYLPLAAKESRFADAAIAVLEGIARDYPESAYAPKVEYQIARLREKATSPDQAIANLSRVAATDPNYLAARFDICRLQSDLWQQADAAGKAAAATATRQAVDLFLAAAQNDGDQERKLRAVLIAIELALAAEPADTATAARYLAMAARFAAGLDDRRPSLAEYHYQAFRLAQATGDAKATETHADWLAHGAAGTRYELAALVVVARKLNAAIEAAPPDERAARLAEAVDVYTRLARHYGDTAEAIAEQKNALVVASRLANFLSELGRHEEAAKWLAPIVAAYPSEKSYLRRAGLAEFHAGQFDKSLPRWRTLLAGLNSASPDWHEAKYHQLACLAKVDRPQAVETFQQYLLLHGSSGPAPWRDKIKELGRTLGK